MLRNGNGKICNIHIRYFKRGDRMDALENTIQLIEKYICRVEELLQSGKISTERYKELVKNKIMFLNRYCDDDGDIS